MKSDRIEFLLNRYYSGEISPDEYEELISAFKEFGNLTPELEIERRILFAIESCEPVMPDDLEKKLTEAIDEKRRKSNNIIKIIFSGAAAAVVLICLTIGVFRNSNKGLSDSEYIAGNSITHRESQNTTPKTAVYAESAVITETAETSTTATAKTDEMVKTDLSRHKKESLITEISDEELDNAVQTVDDALLNVLSCIHMAQNEVVESLENIQINKTTDFNI